jgi:hypothetical protein
MNIEDDIWNLPVGMRCHNAFKRNGIKNLADLIKMTKFDLLMLDNLGKKSVQEIVEVLAEMGLSLSVGPEDHYRWVQMGKQVNRQLKGLANMKEEFNHKESETEEQSTWMERTGGYARDMTLRDHYAGLAMQAVMGNRKQQEYWGLEYSVEEMKQFTAENAYAYADAMLKAREK